MLAARARDCAYGICGLLVGGARRIAALAPKVVRRASGDVQTCGYCSQTGEVMPAEAPDGPPPLWRGPTGEGDDDKGGI